MLNPEAGFWGIGTKKVLPPRCLKSYSQGSQQPLQLMHGRSTYIKCVGIKNATTLCNVRQN